MKVLVCGGRNYGDSGKLFWELDKLHAAHHFTLVIEGGQTGADRHARSWAISRMVPRRSFKAQWAKYGPSAGPLRNLRMVEETKPDLVVAFPGNNGTASMKRIARAHGVKVVEVAE